MHESVLIEEVVELLVKGPGGVYIDGTAGNGGHAKAIIEKAGAGAFVLAIDRDKQALVRAGNNLLNYRKQVCLRHGNFAEMAGIAREEGLSRVDGILLDLGVSSEQLEESGRGFSFMKSGPLDMRMDPSGGGRTAADLVNGMTEEDLCKILIEFGEEKMARQISRAIVRERAKEPVQTTERLAGIIEKAVGGRRGRINPATRTFQALRISVNDELGSLEKGLECGLGLLSARGRMAVISFHSLEDRIVKRFFSRHAGKWESLQAGGRRWVGEEPVMKILTRKPIMPSVEEMERNTRARSAKLRVAERSESD